MTSSISNSLQQSREEFARHLRERAREAAAASVQQAALSQQYLDLSKKFAELAEQAEQSNLDQLQETFSLLESQLHSGTELAVERTVSADDSQRPSELSMQIPRSVVPDSGRIDSPSGRRSHDASDQTLRRKLPRLHRSVGRLNDGGRYRRKRQVPTYGRL